MAGFSLTTKPAKMLSFYPGVNILTCNPDVERIQRIVLAPPWPETIRKTQKILFPNLVEDCPYRVLDDFILQRRDDQRELHWSPARLWDGLKSVTRSIPCAASASKCSKNSGWLVSTR